MATQTGSLRLNPDGSPCLHSLIINEYGNERKASLQTVVKNPAASLTHKKRLPRNGSRHLLCRVHNSGDGANTKLPHLTNHRLLWFLLPHRVERMCNLGACQIVSCHELLRVKNFIPKFVKLIICMLKRIVRIQFHAWHELENLKQDCVLIFRESEGFEFFHKRILPKKHPTWGCS